MLLFALFCSAVTAESDHDAPNKAYVFSQGT